MFSVGVDHSEAKEFVRALLANKEGKALWFGEIAVKPFVFEDGIVSHFVAVGGAFFKKGVLKQAIKGVFLVDGDFV